jgi:cellulose synthase/poly-beta-1,6-N-acetylglucosamine synthase-like glycosyltransferase
VIAPCRGVDQGLEENLEALYRQDYPNYEIIFVTDNSADPAIAIINKIRSTYSLGVASCIVIAGAATNSGQKVHNLQVATSKIAAETEVIVFVDSDARPHSTWLRSLVAPLIDPELGAATGYRWFLPARGGIATHLRSVWNASIASALGQEQTKNFCWGGSTAIRRSVFDELRIRQRWTGTVSDDFAVTRILKEAKRPIHFVPACLVPSFEDCNFRELFEFTTRQLKITRVYAPHLWKPVLIGSLLFCGIFFTGIALVVINALQGQVLWLAAALLAAIFILGVAKAYVRWRAVSRVLATYRREMMMSLLPHLLIWPFASLLYLVNAVIAAFSRRIEWRGITYELKSPSEAVIIARNASFTSGAPVRPVDIENQ